MAVGGPAAMYSACPAFSWSRMERSSEPSVIVPLRTARTICSYPKLDPPVPQQLHHLAVSRRLPLRDAPNRPTNRLRNCSTFWSRVQFQARLQTHITGVTMIRVALRVLL